MRVNDTEAAQRVAEHENLVGELVEALEIAEKRLTEKCEENLAAFNGRDVQTLTRISKVLAKAREGAQS